MKYLTVAAACIVDGERVLICQRKKDDAFALLWEFPGGVQEAHETLPDAIIREIKEEVGIVIDVIRQLEIFEDENESLHIRVHLFLCRKQKGTVRPLDCNDARFVMLDALTSYALAPVDQKIAAYIKKHSWMLF